MKGSKARMAAERSVGPGWGVMPGGDGGQGSIALSVPMREDSPAARMRPQRLGAPGILEKDNREKRGQAEKIAGREWDEVTFAWEREGVLPAQRIL